MIELPGVYEVHWDNKSYLFGSIDFCPNIRGIYILREVKQDCYEVVAKFRNEQEFSDFFKWFQSMPAFNKDTILLGEEGRIID